MVEVGGLSLLTVKHDLLSILGSYDTKAFGFTMLAMVLYVEFVKFLAARSVLSSHDARKLMHIGAGPVFVLCWPLFSQSPNAASYAALAPFSMTTLFTLVGLGILKDDATVKSMSRTGNKKELLQGPLAYGTVISAVTVLLWRRLAAAISISALCAGDGFADIVGRRFGRAKLPWCPRKSWAGSVGFVGASITAGLTLGWMFSSLGWISDISRQLLVKRVGLASLGAAIVETLPIDSWDNLTVVAAALLVDFWVCRLAGVQM